MGELNSSTTTSVNKHRLVTDYLLSSAVPGRAKPLLTTTTESETDRHHLTGIDLAMKLHYLRGVYFFDKEAAAGITIRDLKPAMYDCLELHRVTSGRIRYPDDDDGSGFPYIKMNDAGVRVVEARCDGTTIEEWLRMDDDEFCCGISDELLVYKNELGPDLQFSPLVFVQFTWFKCGGISVGLTWAHVLGDAFSAAAFMTSLGRFIQSNHSPPPPPSQPLRIPPRSPTTSASQPTTHPQHNKPPPSPIKQVDPVNTHWTAPPDTNKTISCHTFHFTPHQINRLRSTIKTTRVDDNHIPSFHLISAVIWRSIARIRKLHEPNTITVCRHYQTNNREHFTPFNGCVITVPDTTTNPTPRPSESELSDLIAALRTGNAKDESEQVREFVERESGSDFVIYGANLTFVDLETLDLYGFGVNGKKPVFANYTIAGVASGGAVLVLPAPEREGEMMSGGRMVTVMLDEVEIEGLKREIKQALDVGGA